MRLCSSLLLIAFLLLPSCSTNSHLPQDRADRFQGLALSNFDGPDGADPAVQAVARAICEGREYDLTPVGFQIIETNAALTTTAAADPQYGGGHGPLSIVQLDPKDNFNTIGRVSFTIPGASADQAPITLACSFSRPQAQHALNTPGVRFAVNWRISFTLDETARVLTADQVLQAVDFRVRDGELR